VTKSNWIYAVSSYMFESATAFNQDISSWDTSKVKNMADMFNSATSFNQDISSWDVSSSTNMIRMFKDASAFNQELSWCTPATSKSDIFDGSEGTLATCTDAPAGAPAPAPAPVLGQFTLQDVTLAIAQEDVFKSALAIALADYYGVSLSDIEIISIELLAALSRRLAESAAAPHLSVQFRIKNVASTDHALYSNYGDSSAKTAKLLTKIKEEYKGNTDDLESMLVTEIGVETMVISGVYNPHHDAFRIATIVSIVTALVLYN
jgi:surface protein